MSNWYKPRYKIIYTLRSKIWPYQRSRLRGIVDKRGSVLFRRGYVHRQKRVLKNLKWMLIRRRFGITLPKFSWKIRRKNRFLSINQQYKVGLQQKQTLLASYGKFDQTSLKRFYKAFFIKSKNYKLLTLLRALEMRSHVILYRLKIFPTIFSAHQYISHQGILINNNLTKQPNKILNPGDIISLPKKHWIIFTYLLYNKIYSRLHREALNWARTWYKLHWYKRLLKTNIIENPELFISSNSFLNLSKNKNSLYNSKNNKYNILNTTLNNNINKTFKVNKLLLKNRNFIKKRIFNNVNYNNKLKKVFVKTNIKNLIYLNKQQFIKKNFILRNNESSFLTNLPINRIYLYYWIASNYLIPLKLIGIEDHYVQHNIKKNIINTSSNISLIQYFNNNFYLKQLNKKQLKLSQENLLLLKKHLYILKLSKNFEKIYLKFYVWILKYSSTNLYTLLNKFILVYKLWSKPLVKIYGLLNKLTQNNIIYNNLIKLSYNILIQNNKNKLILKNLFYYLLFFQYKLKKDFFNLIGELNSIKWNKFYFESFSNIIKNFTILEFSINKQRHYQKIQIVVLENYINLLKEKKFKHIKELIEYSYNIIKKIENELLLNKFANNNLIGINSKETLYLLIQNYVYKLEVQGLNINEIQLNLSNILFKLLKEKIMSSRSIELFKNSFLDNLDSVIEQKKQSNNFNFQSKSLFWLYKKQNIDLLEEKLNINIVSNNKHRIYRLKKYFILYEYLFKNKSLYKKNQDILIKNSASLIQKNIESRLRMNFFKDNSINLETNFDLSTNTLINFSNQIHPVQYKKINYLLNIYQKLKLVMLPLNLITEEISDNNLKVFNDRIWKNKKYFSLKPNETNQKIHIQKLLRLRLLLKKKLIQHKRKESKMQYFRLKQSWYVPNYIEIDYNTYRFIILSNPYISDIITGLGIPVLYKSILNFLARKGS